MLAALSGARHVSEISAQHLMLLHGDVADAIFLEDWTRPQEDSLPLDTVVDLSNGERRLVLFNSLSHSRHSLVTVRVSEPRVVVTNELGKVVRSQADPVFLNNEDISESSFLLHFEATAGPLSLVNYAVRSLRKDEVNDLHSLAGVIMYNAPGTPVKS